MVSQYSTKSKPIFKENWKNYSWCGQNEDWFDYHGIEKALCGKIGYSTEDRIRRRLLSITTTAPDQRNIENPFTLKRLLVIQMQ